jgi:hypothetical protein
MPNITPNPAHGGRSPGKRGLAAPTGSAPARNSARTPARTPAGPARPVTGASAALVAVTLLTDRDRYLLQVLAEHQVLTADQIARLKFTDANTARKRLVLLTRRGVLDRFRDGVRPGSQAWRYTLGPLGATIVAAEHARPAPRPSVHAQQVLRLARSPRLTHLLGVNEFFVALAHHARQDRAYALRWWWNEHRATTACAGLAHPDGLGAWTHRDPHGVVREVVFFVEHDEGSEQLHRLTEKLAGYAQARLGGGPAHPVLFWLPTLAREANLHAHLARHPCPAPVVATATRQHADAAGLGPAGPVWLPLGHTTRHRLIDLGGSLPVAAPPTRRHAPAPAPAGTATAHATASPRRGHVSGAATPAWPPRTRGPAEPGTGCGDGHATARAGRRAAPPTGSGAAWDRPDPEGDLPHVA